MSSLTSSNAPKRRIIVRSEGTTKSERYLSRLCERSFLSLWSYASVFRDQGRQNGTGDGKEVCDLLVVFENHVIIFSDKYCEFADSGNLLVDWARWYKKAVLSSAVQVWGAERWIRNFPQRLFLDKKCEVPFPITLPHPSEAIFHRVVVAHDGSRRCAEVLRGSGSLMLDNTLIGDDHLGRPFTIGQPDPGKGYVHVFDDTTLDIILTTVDTVSDFLGYLTKKERFLTSAKHVIAAGEEELLAVYLSRTNSSGEHDFVFKEQCDAFDFSEGHWDRFQENVQRKAQIESDRISYAWDRLIEKFTHPLLTNTQFFGGNLTVAEQERFIRFLAREPRTRRRMLATSLFQVLERSRNNNGPWQARVLLPSGKGDPYYVFLCAKRPPNTNDQEYRRIRSGLLCDYCNVVKLRYPAAQHIIGIATEDAKEERRSEDLVYLNAQNWTAEQQQRAREAQDRMGLLKRVATHVGREHDYPVGGTGRVVETTISRNSPCKCGSGLRFKRCCGGGLFEKPRRH